VVIEVVVVVEVCTIKCIDNSKGKGTIVLVNQITLLINNLFKNYLQM